MHERENAGGPLHFAAAAAKDCRQCCMWQTSAADRQPSHVGTALPGLQQLLGEKQEKVASIVYGVLHSLEALNLPLYVPVPPLLDLPMNVLLQVAAVLACFD